MNNHHKYTYEELPDSAKFVVNNSVFSASGNWKQFKAYADEFLKYNNFSYDPAYIPMHPSMGERLTYCFSIPIEILPLYINAFDKDFLIDTVKLRLKLNK